MKGVHLMGEPGNAEEVAAAARTLHDLLTSQPNQMDEIRTTLSEAVRQSEENAPLFQGWDRISQLWLQHALALPPHRYSR
jgi:hypothetical protein